MCWKQGNCSFSLLIHKEVAGSQQHQRLVGASLRVKPQSVIPPESNHTFYVRPGFSQLGSEASFKGWWIRYCKWIFTVAISSILAAISLISALTLYPPQKKTPPRGPFLAKHVWGFPSKYKTPSTFTHIAASACCIRTCYLGELTAEIWCNHHCDIWSSPRHSLCKVAEMTRERRRRTW